MKGEGEQRPLVEPDAVTNLCGISVNTPQKNNKSEVNESEHGITFAIKLVFLRV